MLSTLKTQETALDTNKNTSDLMEIWGQHRKTRHHTPSKQSETLNNHLQNHQKDSNPMNGIHMPPDITSVQH